MCLKHIIAKSLTLALVCALCISALLPVTASAAEGTMVELLEYSTVNNSGSNMFNFTTTTTVYVDTPMYARLQYIDIIFTVSDNTAPTSVKVRYNNAYTSLTVAEIATGVYRAYGKIGGYYKQVYIQFNAAGTQYYTLQSCRVSSVIAATVESELASYQLSGHDYLEYGMIREPVTIPESGTDYAPVSCGYMVAISVPDAVSWDTVFVHGSVTNGSIESIRCTYATEVLPFTVNYIDSESTGEYNQETGSTDFTVNFYGKLIYALEIDMSGVDRSLGDELLVYISGRYADYTGMTFNLQSVAGNAEFADTTNATWWTRVKAFFTDLLGGDTAAGEEYAATMESQSQQMQDAVDQMDEVTRPPVDDLDISVDAYVDPDAVSTAGSLMGELIGNELILSMTMIALTVALASFIIFGKR